MPAPASVPQLAVARQEPAREAPFPKDIKGMLRHERTVRAMRAVIPSHIKPEMLVKTAVWAIDRQPKLLQADAMTLLGAFMHFSSLGLQPNGPLGHAYILPFKNGFRSKRENRDVYDVVPIIGYKGYIDLGMRSGLLKSVHGDVVFDGDEFDFCYGSDAKLVHKPTPERDRARPLYAYCHCKLEGGEAFVAMPWADVMLIKARSPSVRGGGESPWKHKDDEIRMARKTAIRQLFQGGEIPLTSELARAVATDDKRVDFGHLGRAIVESPDDASAILDGVSEQVLHDEDGVVPDKVAEVPKPEEVTEPPRAAEPPRYTPAGVPPNDRDDGDLPSVKEAKP